jgi:serine protease Do
MSNDTQRSTRRTSALAAVLLATTMLAGGTVIGRAWSVDSPATPAPVTAGPSAVQPGFAELVKRVKPAVVNISTTERAKVNEQALQNLPPEFRPFFEQRQAAPSHALGSGFIIDPAGYVVTNNHVVDGATKIMITTEDGSVHPAKVVGRDSKTDLALVKIDAGKPLPYVAFGDSEKAQVGDWVIAVGNPFGLGGSVTAGIISAHGRQIDAGPYDDFLQIDAPINPGNSGGPLFSQSGQVIGIDTAIFSPSGGSVGIGFAIPSNLASKVVAQLREHGSVERGWLGVQMQPITPPLAKAMGRSATGGVLVDTVVPNSPATGKLQQGDVITAFNGKDVKTPRDLAMDVADVHAGSAAKLTVWRDGAEKSVDVTIGTQKAQTAANEDASQGAKIGLALAPLTDEARNALGLDATVHGVVVAQVEPGSPAAESGVHPKDIITRIGQDAVSTPSEAAAKIHAAEHAEKDAVPLLVMRDGAPYYLALQLKA